MGRRSNLTHELISNREKLDAEILGIVGAKGADVVIETTGNSMLI